MELTDAKNGTYFSFFFQLEMTRLIFKYYGHSMDAMQFLYASLSVCYETFSVEFIFALFSLTS